MSERDHRERIRLQRILDDISHVIDAARGNPTDDVSQTRSRLLGVPYPTVSLGYLAVYPRPQGKAGYRYALEEVSFDETKQYVSLYGGFNKLPPPERAFSPYTERESDMQALAQGSPVVVLAMGPHPQKTGTVAGEIFFTPGYTPQTAMNLLRGAIVHRAIMRDLHGPPQRRGV